MSAPNKATEMVSEFVVEWWSQTDAEPEDFNAEMIEDWLLDFGEDILACEPYTDDGEPFPEWTTLVMTPAINSTIDYNWITEQVRVERSLPR